MWCATWWGKSAHDACSCIFESQAMGGGNLEGTHMHKIYRQTVTQGEDPSRDSGAVPWFI